METEIILGHNFTKIQLEQLGITNSNELNGWYNYDTQKATINITSGDFSRKRVFNTISKFFTQIVTHEILHHIIWEVIKNESANYTEEKFVELMTGERKWKKNGSG